MTRNSARAALSRKSNEYPVVYQQSKCYAEREQGWDTTCHGLQKVGKKCYTMGACNGEKKLGIMPPFSSAGGRSAAHWADDATSNYERFKFVFGLEHTRNQFGYLTEKFFLPLEAGAIP